MGEDAGSTSRSVLHKGPPASPNSLSNWAGPTTRQLQFP